MSDPQSMKRDKCEHLGWGKFKTSYCKTYDQVLCDNCAVTFYSNCEIFNIIRPAKSKSALNSVMKILNQAQIFGSTYWLQK